MESQPEETQTQDKLPPEIIPASAVEAFAQAMEDVQVASEPVAEIAAAMADGEDIKGDGIEDEGEGRLLIITAEPEAPEIPESIPEDVRATAEAIAEAPEAPAEAEAQPEDSEPAMEPARKWKGKKATVATEGENK